MKVAHASSVASIAVVAARPYSMQEYHLGSSTGLHSIALCTNVQVISLHLRNMSIGDVPCMLYNMLVEQYFHSMKSCECAWRLTGSWSDRLQMCCWSGGPQPKCICSAPLPTASASATTMISTSAWSCQRLYRVRSGLPACPVSGMHTLKRIRIVTYK